MVTKWSTTTPIMASHAMWEHVAALEAIPHGAMHLVEEEARTRRWAMPPQRPCRKLQCVEGMSQVRRPLKCKNKVFDDFDGFIPFCEHLRIKGKNILLEKGMFLQHCTQHSLEIAQRLRINKQS